MASTLQQAVAIIQSNNYMSLVTLSAVGYDYVLTFSDELEYIWKMPWTRISVLFLLTRYVGLCSVIINALWGSSFFPVPGNVDVLIAFIRRFVSNFALCLLALQHIFSGEITDIISVWATLVFVSAVDLAMILRVWALYRQSKLVLCSLLILYAAEVVVIVIVCVITSAQHGPTAYTVQLLDFTFCAQLPIISPRWPNAIDIVEITLGALMCLLVLVQFSKEAVQTYKTRKHLRLNRYMTLLAWEGMVYFLAILAFALNSLLLEMGYVPAGGWQSILAGSTNYIPAYTLAPRFILSLRKLYTNDQRGALGTEIDTAFGLTRVAGHGAGASAIVFAGGGQNEGFGESEGMQMDEWDTR